MLDRYTDYYTKNVYMNNECKMNILYNVINYFSDVFLFFMQRIVAYFSDNGYGGNIFYYDYCVKYNTNDNTNIRFTKISPRFIFRHKEYSSLLNYSCGTTYNIDNNNVYIMYGVGNYKTSPCVINLNKLNNFCNKNDCGLYIYDDDKQEFIDSVLLLSRIFIEKCEKEINKIYMISNLNDIYPYNHYLNLQEDVIDMYSMIKNELSNYLNTFIIL